MKKILLALTVTFIATATFSQSGLYKKKPTIGINFMMNDFRTTERIHNGSVSGVFRDKSWAQIKEMSPGLSVSYLQGLTDLVDFSASLGGSFAQFNFQNKTSNGSSNYFLLEADANVNAKLLSDRYIVNPYASIGVGASLYKVHYGAYIPAGVGIQIKLSDESYLFTTGQYRFGITDKTADHFNYSLGFAAPLGK